MARPGAPRPVLLLMAATAALCRNGVSATQGWSYGIQMDAGSTGTRAFVYKWRTRAFSDPVHPTTLPITQHDWSKKGGAAISSFAQNPSAAGSSLLPLLAFAKDSLLKEGVSSAADLKQVAVFLGATAGMRVLPEQQVVQVMNSIRASLRGSGLMFEDSWARVLSGEEEGAFGWITANYLSGTLFTANASVRTLGALDMGGASFQVTFVPQGPVLADMFPLTINDLHKALYTHSFLFYGSNEAYAQLRAHLASNATASAPKSSGSGSGSGAALVDPCMASGAPAFVAQSVVGGKALSRTYRGGSDPAACSRQARALVRNGVPCLQGDRTQCSFNGVYQPTLPRGMRFIAMSTFYYTWSFFGLPSNADLVALESAANRSCGLSFAQLQAEHNSTKAKYLTKYCFDAYYSIALLHDGLKFPMQATPLDVQDTIKGNDIGWALGAMLYQCNQMRWVLLSTRGAAATWHGSKSDAGALEGVCIATSLLSLVLALALFRCWYTRAAPGKSLDGGTGVPGGGGTSIYAAAPSSGDF